MIDEWHQHQTVFFRVRSIKGERIQGNIMRRNLNGAWQYREMTEDEKIDYLLPMQMW